MMLKIALNNSPYPRGNPVVWFSITWYNLSKMGVCPLQKINQIHNSLLEQDENECLALLSHKKTNWQLFLMSNSLLKVVNGVLWQGKFFLPNPNALFPLFSMTNYISTHSLPLLSYFSTRFVFRLLVECSYHEYIRNTVHWMLNKHPKVLFLLVWLNITIFRFWICFTTLMDILVILFKLFYSIVSSAKSS